MCKFWFLKVVKDIILTWGFLKALEKTSLSFFFLLWLDAVAKKSIIGV